MNVIDNEDNLPINAPVVDYEKVSSLHHRRSVNFMNHFLLNTSNFLNNFSAVSEERLAQQLLEMQKLEVAVSILEAKLNSVPGLNEIAPSSSAPVKSEPQVDASLSSAPTQPEAPTPAELEVKEEPAPVAENVVTAKQDPRYAKYFKMVAVGVPKQAIAGKMRTEGLDPAYLDTPDAVVPDAAPIASDSGDSDNESRSMSSEDDFSD